MVFFDKEALKKYSKNDVVKTLMETYRKEDFDGFTYEKWLRDSIVKRMIFYYIYVDLPVKSKVLDVGGGISSLTRFLMSYLDYYLVEALAHDDEKKARKILKDRLVINDWFDLPEDTYDYVIANDLLPNADQRLSLFIKKFIPLCKELILTITYYDNPRWYVTKRIDADEILTLLAYDQVKVDRDLLPYKHRIIGENLQTYDGDSLFDNGRKIFMVKIKGDL